MRAWISELEKTELRNQADSFRELARGTTGGWWTVNNPNETKWNIFDQNGNDIAMTHQLFSIKEDPKQDVRTANALWIAAMNPRNIVGILDTVDVLLRRVELLELLAKREPIMVDWQFDNWAADEWSDKRGELIHYDESPAQKHVVKIDGEVAVLHGAKLRLNGRTIIGG